MSRGISSVADVTLFLLLVGGAIGTLVAGTGYQGPPGEGGAAETARILATSTATVNYTVAAPTDTSDGSVVAPVESDEWRYRSAHGTLASLLAEAAVAGINGGERRIESASESFRAAVRGTVTERLAGSLDRSQVTAVWEPYPGASLRGSLVVGTQPPADVDVRAGTVTVPSTIPSVNPHTGGQPRNVEFRHVSTPLADAVVRGLFPPNRTGRTLREVDPGDAPIYDRYRRLATAAALDHSPIRNRSVAHANADLQRALESLFRADLRRQYVSPTEIPDDLHTETVRITVRTWSE